MMPKIMPHTKTLQSNRLVALSLRNLESYERLPPYFWDQHQCMTTMIQSFRLSYAALGQKTATLAQMQTILKGLETNANMNASLPKSENKVPTKLPPDQLELINGFLREYQVNIPGLSEAPDYQLSASKNFTLAQTVSLSGAIDTLWSAAQLQTTRSQSEIQGIFNNLKQLFSCINNFEKKALDMKNSFTLGLRG